MDTQIAIFASDGKAFRATQEELSLSEFLRGVLEDCAHESAIHLPADANVTSSDLEACLECCRFFVQTRRHSVSDDQQSVQEEEDAWKAAFLSRFSDTFQKFSLTRAANVLNIPPLLDLLVTSIANDLKGKSVEDIRKALHINVDDLTNEDDDDAMIRSTYEWAFDDI